MRLSQSPSEAPSQWRRSGRQRSTRRPLRLQPRATSWTAARSYGEYRRWNMRLVPPGHAVLIVLVVVTGLAWAVNEHGTPARKLFAVAFGGAVALGVNTLMLGLFGG